MLLNNRVIWKNNATLTDISIEMSNYSSGSKVIDFVAAQDALYIGSDMPFNHRYFDVSVVNALASVPSVQIWSGSAFENTVETLDLTANPVGTSMAQKGILSWVTDRNKVWGREDTTEHIPELSTLKIYNLYWAKITFSADLTATFALNYVGHKFSTDSDLYARYPDFQKTDLLTAFKTGKTTWDEQHVLAAEEIIRDLRKDKVIQSANQVLNWEMFVDASVHKTAKIIYSAFGDDYKDNRETANAEYHSAMNKQIFEIDEDGDGRLDPCEKILTSGFFRG
jgi:hypothetical protein